MKEFIVTVFLAILLIMPLIGAYKLGWKDAKDDNEFNSNLDRLTKLVGGNERQ